MPVINGLVPRQPLLFGSSPLLGGWNHAAGLVLVHRGRDGLTSHWPPGATNRPIDWASAYLGTPPPLVNQPPVASAGVNRALDVIGTQTVQLDGSASHDPEGAPLTYVWSQVAGPAVVLSGGDTAHPSFTVAESNAPAVLRFRLSVGDGVLGSNPVDVEIVLRSVVAQQLSAPPAGGFNFANGAFEANLAWPGEPGERARVEATTNFMDWVSLGVSTVDFTRAIHLSDPAAATIPYRFYRARGVPVTTQLVYFNDFETTVGSEWSFPRSISTSPQGARRFLGQFTSVTKSLTLANLPPHTHLKVSLQLFILKSWDGNLTDFGPDRWSLSVRDGVTLIDTTFSNYDPTQGYPGGLTDNYPSKTGAEEKNTLGYTHSVLGVADAVYDLTFSFHHSQAAVIFDFRGINLQDSTDESWGIDNVRVEAINAP